jgi:hypothetical protein
VFENKTIPYLHGDSILKRLEIHVVFVLAQFVFKGLVAGDFALQKPEQNAKGCPMKDSSPLALDVLCVASGPMIVVSYPTDAYHNIIVDR